MQDSLFTSQLFQYVYHLANLSCIQNSNEISFSLIIFWDNLLFSTYLKYGQIFEKTTIRRFDHYLTYFIIFKNNLLYHYFNIFIIIS